MARIQIDKAAAETIRNGSSALTRIDRSAAGIVENWWQVADGIDELDRQAMRASGSNRPIGGPFSQAMVQLLTQYPKYGRLTPEERSLLRQMLRNKVAIVAWYEQLKATKDQRARTITHPKSILRHWKQDTHGIRPASQKAKVAAATRESLEDTNVSLREENLELRNAAAKRCDIDLLSSEIEAIDDWLEMRVMDDYRARRIRDKLNELYPLPLPKVPVTHPHGSADDSEIGL